MNNYNQQAPFYISKQASEMLRSLDEEGLVSPFCSVGQSNKVEQLLSSNLFTDNQSHTKKTTLMWPTGIQSEEWELNFMRKNDYEQQEELDDNAIVRNSWSSSFENSPVLSLPVPHEQQQFLEEMQFERGGTYSVNKSSFSNSKKQHTRLGDEVPEHIEKQAATPPSSSSSEEESFSKEKEVFTMREGSCCGNNRETRETVAVRSTPDTRELNQAKQEQVNNIQSEGKKSLKLQNKKHRAKGPKFAIRTCSEVDIIDDGYKWRKYGQKAVKNSPYPRGYYRCTDKQCVVKKHVERCMINPAYVVTTYEGIHTHPSPAAIEVVQEPFSAYQLFSFPLQIPQTVSFHGDNRFNSVMEVAPLVTNQSSILHNQGGRLDDIIPSCSGLRWPAFG